MVDYMAEIPIFRKLLASLHFVDDISTADLVLVPALGVTTVIGECRNYGECKKENYAALASHIKENSDTTKPHLYLASQDYSQNAIFFKQQHSKRDIVVTLGPKTGRDDIIVPSLNSHKSLQSSNWNGCRPLNERKTFLSASFGVRGHLKDRITIKGIIDQYSGEKAVRVESPESFEAQDALMDSLFTICPPGTWSL